MKFFLDSANLKDISWATQAGLIDGITTNPSLLAKVASDLDPRDVLKEICSLVEGPVSAEVVAVEADAMVREGHELAKLADHLPFKIPLLHQASGAVPCGMGQGPRPAQGGGGSWVSPPSVRSASPAMQSLWSERRRIGLWRRLWLALLEAERELGLAIPDDALVQLRAHLDDADLDKAADYEERLRHDLMAHIHPLGDQAPAARPYRYLDATSAFVTDSTDLLLMRRATQILLGRVAAVLVALGKLARRHRAVACLAYPHFQAAH